MQIFRVTENQIRCILTKEDLDMRHIKLSELAYGTESARELFHEVMTQASLELGFEAEDTPLMIEAVPLSPDKIVIYVSKVDSPDELDTRFSNFTNIGEMDASENSAEPMSRPEDDIPNELTDILNHLKAPKSPAEEADLLAKKDALTQAANEAMKTPAPEQTSRPQDLYRMFAFRDMNTAIEAAHMVADLEHGSNSLYKDTARDQYLLILRKNPKKASDYNKMVHLLSAYLESKKCSREIKAFCDEHYKVLISNHALKTLSEIA